MTTGQTYQQFTDGFSCTGSQDLTEDWESGDEVNFNLAATDACSGTEQYFAGTGHWSTARSLPPASLRPADRSARARSVSAPVRAALVHPIDCAGNMTI
jgi:hypothetical protein